jgi:hypothetical protein
VLFDLLLGPLIGAVLFPLGLLTILFPFLVVVFDGLLNSLFWVLQKSSEALNDENFASPLAMAWQWVIFFALLFLCYHFLVSQRRKAYEN